MDDDDDEKPIDLLAIDVPQQQPDSAALAFARLQGEIALMRRAVEQLATEKANIHIPDYSTTLGEMAKRLIAIDRHPAMQMTPEDLATRMQAASTQARRDDHVALADAQKKHVEAIRTLRALAGDVASFNEQQRRLKWAVGSGLLAGVLLWAVLPGFIARLVPTGWHWPERIAARTVREPTLWEAGTRIMRAGSPEAWQAIVDAADLRRDNREAIDACERDARKSAKSVRCTIRIGSGKTAD